MRRNNKERPREYASKSLIQSQAVVVMVVVVAGGEDIMTTSVLPLVIIKIITA